MPDAVSPVVTAPDSRRPRVLVVDDEPSIVEVLEHNLLREGFEVHTAGDGRDGLARCRELVPDVLLLDLMLPGTDGLTVCRQLRADPKTAGVRIILITAKGEETDEIVGFSMGADDYVTKPFRVRPLMERVKALVRRPAEEADRENKDRIELGGLVIDRISHQVALGEEELTLTPTEFRILWTLMRQPRRTYSRSELLDVSRGEDANSLERTIDVHVRSLRKKLGPVADQVETVRGIGYRFRPAG